MATINYSELSGVRVAIVDDELAFTLALKELLTATGAQVTVYDNPRDLVVVLTSSPETFDLIITDEMMPQMTGTDLARELRVINPGLPIILYTGYANCIDKEIIAAIGISRVVTKPIKFSSFLDEISSVLMQE